MLRGGERDEMLRLYMIFFNNFFLLDHMCVFRSLGMELFVEYLDSVYLSTYLF